MNKGILTGVIVLMGATVFAETFYLQADMTTVESANSPLIKELWFSQPSGGGTHPMQLTHNTFVVNGKGWRTPNSNMTSQFPGTFLIDETGAGTGELLTSVWKPARLEINGDALMRLRQKEVTLQPGVLSVNGTATFRAHSDGSQALFVEAGSIEGSGRIVFGKYKATDTLAKWSLMANHLAGFTGTVTVEFGTLTIETPLDLKSASLEINTKNSAVLVVDEVVLSIGKLTIDGRAVKPGTYKANQMGVACVKGSGRLMVLQ
jgi:hypothetical protein